MFGNPLKHMKKNNENWISLFCLLNNNLALCMMSQYDSKNGHRCGGLDANLSGEDFLYTFIWKNSASKLLHKMYILNSYCLPQVEVHIYFLFNLTRRDLEMNLVTIIVSCLVCKIYNCFRWHCLNFLKKPQKPPQSVTWPHQYCCIAHWVRPEWTKVKMAILPFSFQRLPFKIELHFQG